ncbi:MAG: hypothetical protein GPJ54_14470 [Candidatus Heimdallarchaeota archaeon]|nr:hypothetical protein [Candidatus Heimdallarchaeota archaeon]
MIAKVYTIVNRGIEALHYAKLCMELTETHKFKDFDLAYANEMMSRSYAGAGDKENSDKYYQLALEASEQIEKDGNKKMFLEDLKSGNWFGMR